MAELFSPEAFYESAHEFARTALEAHHAENYRRVALDAGTALEHLAKAALARRSPALLAELRNDSAPMIAWLLRVDGAKPPARIRTIGLFEALTRVRPFVSSAASQEDLRTLVDMRDAVVHAAQDSDIEARVLIAFVQHADALLADLGRQRLNFWGDHLPVVDVLLADATDKLAHRVAVKLAAAEASYSHEYGTMARSAVHAIRRALEVSKSESLDLDQGFMLCPVCESRGLAEGMVDVEYEEPEWDKTGRLASEGIALWFEPNDFGCRICGLRLNSPAELAEARVRDRWEVERTDYRDVLRFAEYDEDAAYDAWREKRAERQR
jgi:hypothetical protein